MELWFSDYHTENTMLPSALKNRPNSSESNTSIL